MSRTVNSHYALNHIHWDRGTQFTELDEDTEPGDGADKDQGEDTTVTYSHPDLEQAAEWAAAQLNERDYIADFSLQSIHEVDRFFTEFCSEDLPSNQDFFAEDMSFRTFALGAYLGEVLRRATDGEWLTDPTDPLIEVNLEVKLSDESSCLPMEQVLKRLNEGPTASFAKYATDLGFEVPGEPTVEKTDGQTQPAEFDMQGYLTLWYRERENYNEPEYHLVADATACVNLQGYFSFLEEKSIPSLKAIPTLTEGGVELPESQAGGTILRQLGIFYDPALESDYWNLVEDEGQLCIELGRNRLIEFKEAVTSVFLGNDTQIIVGSLGSSIQLWPKALPPVEETESSAEADLQE